MGIELTLDEIVKYTTLQSKFITLIDNIDLLEGNMPQHLRGCYIPLTEVMLPHLDDVLPSLENDVERLKSKYINLVEKKNADARTALYDDLTNIPNQRYLKENFPKLLEESRVEGKTLSVCMLDADYFKKVNDSYGHLEGDEVLKYIGSVLNGELRGGRDIKARYGGEEFLYAIPGVDEEKIIEISERIREKIGNHKFVTKNGEEFYVTMSLGVNHYSPDSLVNQDVESLIKSADQLLYQAKENGRNRVEKHFYNGKLLS